jgi:hypothetical protein
MAFKPSSAPIKTPTLRRAAQTSVEDSVRAVATRFATNLVNFNYQTVDADMQKLAGDTTPHFATTNQAALKGGTVTDFKKAIADRRSVSHGDVKGTAVTSLDKDTATVLVVVLQSVHSTTTNEDNKFHILELTILDNNGWKVDQVGNPSTT